MAGSRKRALVDKLKFLADYLGVLSYTEGDYPNWEPAGHSSLRDYLAGVYKKIIGRDMHIETIHAGLECGFFYNMIEGIDCVSIGPDILDVHSVRERLSISSTKRMWDFLVKALEGI